MARQSSSEPKATKTRTSTIKKTSRQRPKKDPVTAVAMPVADVVLFELLSPAGEASPGCHAFVVPPPSGLPVPLLGQLRLVQQDERAQHARHWGALPADFVKRTGGVSPTDFLAQVQAHPGYDVYVCAAYPELEALHFNPWVQVEVQYPNFLTVAQAFLEAVGLPTAVLHQADPASAFTTGHLLVATPAFWAEYLDFLEACLQQAREKLPEAVRVVLFDEVPAAGRLGYLYLIVARLLALFLAARPAIKAYKVPLLPQELALNGNLRLLRELKDEAIRQRSSWLAACWANYRSLYLAQAMGKPWVVEHLKAITPVQFGLGVALTQYPYVHTHQRAK